MNKKGQALVEFIVIMPVVIFMLLTIIDVMAIFSVKNSLENTIHEVSSLYKEDKTKINNYLKQTKDNIEIEYVEKDNYTKIILINNYKFITPGLNKILDNPYKITVERVITSE